ncbi:sigma-54-dependent transcriptional regulator [Calditrichota bacterium LG25]
MAFKVFLIDDDVVYLKSLKEFLEVNNFQAEISSNPRKAVVTFQNKEFDCVLLDLKMPGLDGIQLLEKFQEIRTNVPIIIVSGEGTIPLAIKAIRMGAYDFIEKSDDPNRILITLNNAIEKRKLLLEKSVLKAQIDETYSIIGQSEAIQKILEKIEMVARSNAKVLITGESGTGKELVARAIHNNSLRAGKPFVKINCAAIPSMLLESELFGHKKGAFTGAHQDYKGKFLVADGGTLFLDEIGDMSPELQAKLLRVLENNEVEVIGNPLPIKVDVRLIAATNQNLPQLIRDGKFREDLFHRLNVIQVHIPPLRERPEDIPPLADHFIKMFAQTYNKPVRGISAQALQILKQNEWTGNIRELRNVIEKVIVLTDKEIIDTQEINEALGSAPTAQRLSFSNGKSLKKALEEYEKFYIEQTLKQHSWKILDSAKALDIDRTALFRKIRKFGIQKDDYVRS